MKKTLFAVTMLCMIIAGGLALADTPAAKSKAAKGTMTDAALQEKLVALERKVWEAFKSQDFAAAKEVMAEDALSADINGYATTAQFEPMMKDYTIDQYDLQEWKILRLGKDAAVLAYTTTVSAKYKGETVPAGPYYCSSVYLNRGGKWVALYHQETLAASAMQAPPAANK
jgi:hypothetical protein